MKRFAALLATACLAMSIAACSVTGGSPQITVTGDFVDINALEHHATVEMAGVNVGAVVHIKLDGSFAKLTMHIRKSAHVPADVTATIRRDSLLGPDVVELTPPPNSAAGDLPNGAVIADAAHPARFEPDFESLVKSGNDLLGTLGAAGTTALAQIISENAQGFGPEGGTLHAVIDNLNTIVSGYATRTQTITALLHNLDTFASTLGPNAQANAQALANLANTTAVLDRQKDRLVTLLGSLSQVSVEGAALLQADLGLITDQLNSIRSVTQALANQQAALGRILYYLPGHNAALSLGIAKPEDFVQVLNDFVVCGLPGHAGGDIPGDLVNSCYDAGNGKP